MKEPRTTIPGSKEPWEMRTSITRRKMRAREDVAISNGKILLFLSLVIANSSAKWGNTNRFRGKRRGGERGGRTRESRLGGCFECL